jgi:hypothetical protein
MFTIRALKPRLFDAPAKDSLNWIPNSSEVTLLSNKNFQCECCGLQSRAHRDYKSGYLEIVNIEGVEFCLCSFCAQSQYLGRPVNGRSNHGLIFYCPELTQGQISKLALWSFIAKLRGNQFAAQANKLISLITRDLIEPVSGVIPGLTSGDVQEFADMYENLSPKLISNTPTLFAALKYWPNEVVFESQIKFWNVAAFRNVTDELEATCKEIQVAR